MKRMKYAVILVAAALSLQGCIHDESTEGMFAAVPVKLVPDDTRTFPVGEEAVFDPIIEWNGSKESDFTYRWVLNGVEDISTERVLHYKFTEIGQQYLNLILTDGHGLTYNQEYMVTVSTPFQMGWVVLSRGSADASQLSFLPMDYAKFYPDIYATLHPDKPLGTGPLGIVNHCVRTLDEIVVRQSGGGWPGVVGDSFAAASSLEEEFINGKYPDEPGGFEPVICQYTHRGEDFVISRNGLLYDRQTNSPTAATTTLYDVQFNSVPWTYKGYDDTPRYTYACKFCGTYYTPVFDDANKRWIPFGVSVITPRNIVGMKTSGTVPDGFNYVTGMDADVNLLYAQNYTATASWTSTSQLFQVLEKGGHVYANKAQWALSPLSGAGTVTVSGIQHKEIPADCGITKDTPMWMMCGGTGTPNGELWNNPFLFFAKENALYLYHFPTGIVKLVRDFTKGSHACSGKIVSLCQNGDGTRLAVLCDSGDLYVMKMTMSDAMGLVQNNIDPDDPDGNGLEETHASGVPGTPIQVIFKYGKADNWINFKILY